MTEKVFESQLRVRFNDCDPFQHLNNANYISYFFMAREDQEREYMQFDDMAYLDRSGKNWVTYKNQIVYLSEVPYKEIVTIQSSIIRWEKTEYTMEFWMWDEQKTVLKSIMWSVWVHFDLKTKKRAEHDAYLDGIFRPLENRLPDDISFDDRVLQIKNSLR